MSNFILFLEDWKRFPTAQPHWKSANKSALILSATLEAMGVQNNLFFMALLDQSLAEVDPYDPNLTAVQMGRISREIILNPWYFFREVARAPAISGVGSIHIEFNRANISLWWSFFNHATYILTQPRQTGKSFNTDQLMTGLMNFWTANTQINLMTKDDKLRGENIKRLKDIYEELPAYLKMRSKGDVNNTEELSVKALGNTYKTHVPGSSEKMANNLGRGLTTPIFHVDEAPFQRFIKTACEAAFGSMGAAIEAAKRNNQPYGIIFTTTAGKRDDRDGSFVFKYVQEAAAWNEKFYDAKDWDELYAMVTAKATSRDFRIYGSFTHTHLGKTDEWLKEVLRRTGATGDVADRDFFNVWTAGSQTSPLPTYLLEQLKKSMTKPIGETYSKIGGYWTRWYIPENQIESYMATHDTVVGMDSSDAVGKDDLSFVLSDVITGKVIAVNTVNLENLNTYAMWLSDQIERYPRMTVVPERRSSAIGIIDYLLYILPMKGIDPFKRIFNWVVNDPEQYKLFWEEVQMPMARRPTDLYVRAKRLFGFATSGAGETARSTLYGNILQNAVKRFAPVVQDEFLIYQLLGLVIRNGRVDHEVGKHDDLVIGWLMSHWFMSRAKNLHFYGIDASQVLIVGGNDPVQSGPLTFEHQEQFIIRDRLQQLLESMQNEDNEVLLQRYENEIRGLDQRLVLFENEHFSVDHALKFIRDQKNTQVASDASTYSDRYGYEDTANEANPYTYA